MVATALELDEGTVAGIDSHRASRPKGWNVVEEPYALALALRRADAAGHVLIVDCLTLWVTQMLEDRFGSKGLDCLGSPS